MKGMIPKKTRKRRSPEIQQLHISEVAHIDTPAEV
jgi:hypothetical protein